MEVTCESPLENAVILRVKGRIDGNTAPGLEKLILSNLSKPEEGCVLDLSCADYISSAGLRVLVIAVKTAKTSGSHFSIFGLQDSVREILDTTGLIPMMIIYANEKSALDFLKK
jgi:anti-anti-sigma factor